MKVVADSPSPIRIGSRPTAPHQLPRAFPASWSTPSRRTEKSLTQGTLVLKPSKSRLRKPSVTVTTFFIKPLLIQNNNHHAPDLHLQPGEIRIFDQSTRQRLPACQSPFIKQLFATT
ncbi:MAG: hypothetical protein IPH54_20690 [Rhodoferax sp.]|nr:hypothetical protein [Rhodoferax sp.]